MSEYCKNCFELAEKLTKKERECNTLKSQLDFAVRQKERFEQQCEALKSEGFTRESLITEQENEIDELKHENEELKERLVRTEEDLKYQCVDCMNVKSDRYRKALEEIEEELKEDIYCESQECGCNDSEECLRCTKDLILNIINKAKDGKNEKFN